METQKQKTAVLADPTERKNGFYYFKLIMLIFGMIASFAYVVGYLVGRFGDGN